MDLFPNRRANAARRPMRRSRASASTCRIPQWRIDNGRQETAPKPWTEAAANFVGAVKLFNFLTILASKCSSHHSAVIRAFAFRYQQLASAHCRDRCENQDAPLRALRPATSEENSQSPRRLRRPAAAIVKPVGIVILTYRQCFPKRLKAVRAGANIAMRAVQNPNRVRGRLGFIACEKHWTAEESPQIFLRPAGSCDLGRRYLH